MPRKGRKWLITVHNINVAGYKLASKRSKQLSSGTELANKRFTIQRFTYDKSVLTFLCDKAVVKRFPKKKRCV